MTTTSPLISIVIPTRNRAHLLQHALRSAINQNFDDYEIVVIANDCQDKTRDVALSMENDRIRHVETGKYLTMPDNWEFGWTQARGEYVTFLADDDALTPTALRTLVDKTLHGNPEIVSWEDAIFYYPDWHDKRLQNLLLLFHFGDTEVEDVDPAFYLKQLAGFDFSWTAPIPKILNCLAHRATFENWRKRLGRLFYPSTPDYSFGWIATQVCPSIRVLHRPLTVRTISDYSVGSNGGLGEPGKEHFKGFGEINFFSENHYDQPLLYNYIADCYLRVNKDLARCGIEPHSFDWDKFCIAMAKQLNDSRELLPDWTAHKQNMLEQTKQFFPRFQDQIETILASPPATVNEAESLRDAHARTASMAAAYSLNLEMQTKQHAGDEECGACVLALKREILVDPDWAYLYLFGETVNASDPYAMSLHVDHYYNLMSDCRKKKALAPAVAAALAAPAPKQHFSFRGRLKELFSKSKLAVRAELKR